MTQVTEHLQTLGVPFEPIPHPQADTSIDEARALGIEASEVVKTVAVRVAGRYALMAVPATGRLDMHLVQAAVGDRHARLATVRGASGRWLVLHASHLTSASSTQVAVIIEPAGPAELEPVIATGYGLTAREAQAMTLVLRGLPTKTIAKKLRVTMNTANDHIKAIFAKTGVSSRGELMATVFRDQSAPRS